MATAAGNLVVHLMAQTNQFEAGMKRSAQHTGAFRRQVGTLPGGLAQARGAAGSTTVAVNGLNAAMAALMLKLAVVLAPLMLLRKGASVFSELSAAGEEFNQSMRQSLAIMGDVSTGMSDRMGRAAIAASRNVTASASEVAGAYYFLASAGLNAEQSIAALPQVTKFAQAGMFDLSTATDLATDAQSALGLTVKDAQQNLANLTRVTDVLIGANTLANASALQFSEALTNKAGAALRVLNKDVEEGVAVLAVFADQGIKGAEAGTALGIVLRDLQTKALENAEAFDRFGVRVYDASGTMNALPAIVRDLEGALDGMSDARVRATMAEMGFADRSVAYIQALLGTSDAIETYEGQLRNMGGITEEVAGKQLTDMQKATAELSASFTAAGVAIADAFGPATVRFIKALAWYIEAVASGMERVLRLVRSSREDRAAAFSAVREEGGGWNSYLDALENIERTRESAAGNAAAGEPEAESRGERYDDFLDRLEDDILGPRPSFDAASGASALDILAPRGGDGASMPFPDLSGMESMVAGWTDRLNREAELAPIGESLRLALETPVEAFSRRMRELEDLAEFGAIDADTHVRALTKLRDEFGPEADAAAGPTRFAGAMEKGSREAYSAILASQGLGRDTPEAETAKNTKQQVEMQAEANRRLAEIAAQGANAVEIPPA